MEVSLKAQNPKELLGEWHVGVKLRLLSHYECAKRLDNVAARLGIPVVICSACTSVVSTLSATDYPWAATATTCISLLVLVLTGLSAFMKPSEQAEEHRTVANQFSVMRRDIEVILVCQTDVTEAIIRDIEKRWNDIDANSPTIPDAVYQRHYDRLFKVPVKVAK